MMLIYITVLILIILCCDQIFYTNGLNVEISITLSGNKSGPLGKNGTEIECSYIPGNYIQLSVSFLAFNKSSTIFEPIALYIPDQTPILLETGQYLKGRVTLTPITQSSTKAVLTFNKLMCIDDTFYKCKVFYQDANGIQLLESDNISISVQVPGYELIQEVPPSKPDYISLFVNLPLKLKPVLNEGYNVTCVCTGDVGSPPGKFIFQKYRRGNILSMNYTATETSMQALPDNCSYYRTSNTTLHITAEDNKAVIRCVIVSPLTEENMYIESESLDVKFAVKIPTIVQIPNKTDYLVGLDNSISLNCTTDGNPKPIYLWYKDNQIETISTGETLTIANVTTKNSGIYTCFVSNIFNDGIHTQRIQVHVNIIKEANEGPSSTVCTNDNNKTPVMNESHNENTAVIVVGTVCGSIILVLCVILFGFIQNKNKMFRCFLIRKRHDRSIDYANTTQQQNPSLYEGVGQSVDLRNYEQLSRSEHLYNNANVSNN